MAPPKWTKPASAERRLAGVLALAASWERGIVSLRSIWASDNLEYKELTKAA